MTKTSTIALLILASALVVPAWSSSSKGTITLFGVLGFRDTKHRLSECQTDTDSYQQHEIPIPDYVSRLNLGTPYSSALTACSTVMGSN